MSDKDTGYILFDTGWVNYAYAIYEATVDLSNVGVLEITYRTCGVSNQNKLKSGLRFAIVDPILVSQGRRRVTESRQMQTAPSRGAVQPIVKPHVSSEAWGFAIPDRIQTQENRTNAKVASRARKPFSSCSERRR